MPLSEMHKLTTRGNLEKAQTKTSTYSSDLSSFMPDSEFVELLWENGQIVMHGQSNRPRKSIGNAVSSLSVKGQDKDECPKLGRFGAVDSLPNELSHIVPSGIGLNTQDDYAAPWMNYSVEDPLQNDYCSEFLSEFSGVDLNAIANDNICTPADRSNGFGLGRDSQKAEHGHASRGPAGGSDPSRIRTSNLFRLPQQCQSSVPNPKSRTVELDAYGSSSNHQGSSVGILTERTQKQNLANSKQTGSGTSFLNFSHFSRPVALAKANLQSAQRLKSNEKESAAASSSRSESTLINCSGAALKSVGAIQGNSAPVPCDVVLGSATKASQDRAFIQPSEVIDAYKNQYNSTICNDIGRPTDHSNHQSRGFVSSTALARPEIDKAPEAAVASSVCSGFTPGATSNDPKHGAKRKIREGEENEYQSEDIEDESVGKKPAPGRSTSAKRSRAAEVHNLSERRRRDRINERMRALQELIPNCSKVDKASMLDEAIEYLKTLQLQVQIMSMGSGLCMPPIMLPPGMQHIRAPLMGHYSPMGVGMGMGMGMGMGYGMGMLDMNGSPGCPLIPVPPMHGPQYACSSIAGAPGLHGMPPTSSLQMFGIPGQGLPVSIPLPQQYNSFSALPLKQNTTPEIPGAATSPVTAPSAETAPSSRSKDLLRQNMNLERPLKASTANSSIQTTSIQVAKECPQQPTAARISDHTLLGTINATPEDEIAAS